MLVIQDNESCNKDNSFIHALVYTLLRYITILINIYFVHVKKVSKSKVRLYYSAL